MYSFYTDKKVLLNQWLYHLLFPTINGIISQQCSLVVKHWNYVTILVPLLLFGYPKYSKLNVYSKFEVTKYISKDWGNLKLKTDIFIYLCYLCISHLTFKIQSNVNLNCTCTSWKKIQNFLLSLSLTIKKQHCILTTSNAQWRES